MAEFKKAPARGLNRIKALRRVLIGIKRWFYVSVMGMDIDPSVEFSLSAKFDMTFPKGVSIGRNSYIAFEAKILTHDRTRGLYTRTRIGENCFIGGRSMILPGIEIGDGSIVGAGAVVTKSVPPGSVVVGNPAKVVRSGIKVLAYGRLPEADATESQLVEEDFFADK